MDLTDEEFRRLVDVLDADPAVGIVGLAQLAGLPRDRAFRGAVLQGTVFTRDDELTGYDFAGADFMGASVAGADFRAAIGLNKAYFAGILGEESALWPDDLRRTGTMVLIRPRPFTMGTTSWEHWRQKVPEQYRSWETPAHTVTIEQPFYMAKYPVTVGEFRQFMSESDHVIAGGAFTWIEGKGWQQTEDASWEHPGFTQDDTHRVTCVSYEDAMAYVRWLSKRTGRPYRLSSEAEWECACRAGTSTSRFWGNDLERARDYANVADRSLAMALKMTPDSDGFFPFDDGFPFTSPVGSFRPNPWGLYDMLGNVWEWCEDQFVDNYKAALKNGATVTISDSNASRVLRGGAWIDDPWIVRAGARGAIHPGGRSNSTGFRVARTLSPLEF